MLRCILGQIWKYWLQLVVTYRTDKPTCSKWGKFCLLSSIWPWRSKSIGPQNNRALNQGLLHLWSKFGDPSLNSWWIIARTSSWLTDTQTHTHAGNDNTRRPKLASGNNRLYELVSPTFEIAIVPMPYESYSKSYVWDSNRLNLCHTDGLASRPCEISIDVMSYGWNVKSNIWDSNSPYAIRTSLLVIRIR